MALPSNKKNIRLVDVVVSVDYPDKLDRRLDRLKPKVFDKVMRPAIRAAGNAAKQDLKNAAPVGKYPQGISKKPGNLKRSMAVKVKTYPNSGPVAIVGSRYSGPSNMRGPHQHLVLFGTRLRFTKSGASRGIMPANNFRDRVFKANRAKYFAIIRTASKVALDVVFSKR